MLLSSLLVSGLKPYDFAHPTGKIVEREVEKAVWPRTNISNPILAHEQRFPIDDRTAVQRDPGKPAMVLGKPSYEEIAPPVGESIALIDRQARWGD